MAAAKKKGKDDDGPKVYLGRPGNSVQIGIVGMPNVGKSSLFNIMSKLNVAAENYPFCTIDPNVSRVPVPDERFDFLVDVHKPKSVVPAVLAVTDIAGLVKGAAAGQGLGNAFLSHISAVDGIFHVCRAFNDKDVEHVEATVDPVRDLEIISNELRLKDLEKVEREKKIAEDRVNRGIDKTKPAIEKKDILIKVHEMLTNGKDIRNGDWKPKDVDVLNELLLLSAKPVVYLVNVSEKDYIRKGNKWLVKIFEWVKANSPGSPIIPFSITYETKHLEMSADDQKKFEEETKSQSKIPKIITTGYDALDLIHFFTSGSDEVRAWTVRKGSKAPQAAGVIHTDFEKGFIMAETMSFEDFKKHGSEAACKAAGRYRMEGKNYTVQDGDIFFFKFNAAGGAKKK